MVVLPTVLMEAFPSERPLPLPVELPAGDFGVSGIVVVRRGSWAPCYYSDRIVKGLAMKIFIVTGNQLVA